MVDTHLVVEDGIPYYDDAVPGTHAPYVDETGAVWAIPLEEYPTSGAVPVSPLPTTRRNGEPLTQGDEVVLTSQSDATRAIGMRVWDGTAWVKQVLLAEQVIVPGSIGTILLGEGVVTAPKIVASEEFSAKVGQFLSVKASQLVADAAAMNAAFIAKLVGEDAFLTNLLSKKVVVAGNPANKVSSVLIENGAVNADHITASQSLSAKVAQFLKVKAGMLEADGATIQTAFIEQLVGTSAFFANILAEGVVVAGNSTNKVGAVNIADGAVTAPKITASVELSAKVAQFLSVKTSQLVWDTAAGNSAWIGSLVSDSAFLTNLRAKKVVVAGDPTNKVGTVLIEDGAITAPKITASEELSAKVAEFIEIKTSKLVWDTAAGNAAWITSLVGSDAFLTNLLAQRLVVAGGSVLLNDAFTAGWTRNNGTQAVVAAPIAGPGGQPAVVAAAGTGITYAGYYGVDPTYRVGVDGAEQFSASAWVYSTTAIPAGSVGIGIVRYTATGTRTTANSAWPTAIPANTWTRIEVPVAGTSTTRAVGLQLYKGSDAPGPVYFAEPSLVRKVGAVLIENGAVSAPHINAAQVWADGTWIGYAKIKVLDADSITGTMIQGTALDGKTITGATIQTVATANRGVKLTSTGLRAYDNSGNLTASILGTSGTLTGYTVTGGVVRTAASGPRVTLDTTPYLSVYDANRERIRLDGNGDMTAWTPGGTSAFQLRTVNDADGGTYLYGPSFSSYRSYLRLGIGSVAGTKTPQAWVGFDGGQDSSKMWVHGWGAWYLGGNRGRISLENASGEVAIRSRAGLLGIYDIPATTMGGQYLTIIQGSSGLRSVYYNTSLRSAKVDIRDIEGDPYAVLALRPRTFLDRTQCEQYTDALEAAQLTSEGIAVPAGLALREGMVPPRRIPGLIAEEVAETFPELASYDDAGNLSGVQYDRIGVYLLAAVRALVGRVASLEDTTAALGGTRVGVADRS